MKQPDPLEPPPKKTCTEGEIIPDNHVQNGMKAINRKDLKAAKVHFNEALIEGTENYLCYFYLGLVQHADHDGFHSVNEMFKIAFDKAPDNACKLKVLSHHIKICRKAGKTGTAKKLLRKVPIVMSNLNDAAPQLSIIDLCAQQLIDDIEVQDPDWEAISESIDLFMGAYNKLSPEQQEVGTLSFDRTLSLLRKFADQNIANGNSDMALKIYQQIADCCEQLMTRYGWKDREQDLPAGSAEEIIEFFVTDTRSSILWLHTARDYFTITESLRSALSQQKEAMKEKFDELSSRFLEARNSIKANAPFYLKFSGLQDNLLFKKIFNITLDPIPHSSSRSNPDQLRAIISELKKSSEDINPFLWELGENSCDDETESDDTLPTVDSVSPFRDYLMVNSQDMIFKAYEIFFEHNNLMLITMCELVSTLAMPENLNQDQMALKAALADSMKQLKKIETLILLYFNHLKQLKPNQNHAPVKKRGATIAVNFLVNKIDILVEYSKYALESGDINLARKLDNEMDSAFDTLIVLAERTNNVSVQIYSEKIKKQRESLQVAIIHSLNDKHNLDPLALNYGKKGQSEPHTFPSAALERAIKFVRANYPDIRPNLNLSVHCLTVAFRPKNSKETKLLSLPICASIELADNKIQVITIDELTKPKNWKFSQDTILARIQAGWDLLKPQNKGNRPEQFDARFHKHSEQVFYSLLKQVSPEELCERINKESNGKFQPGAKIQFIAIDSFSERTSCYHCRLSALAEMSTSTSYGSFAKRMQNYLLKDEKYRVSGSKHGNSKLKMVSRVLAFKDYSFMDKKNKNPVHINLAVKNIKTLNNLGIFQTVLPSGFASGSRNRLMTKGRK